MHNNNGGAKHKNEVFNRPSELSLNFNDARI